MDVAVGPVRVADQSFGVVHHEVSGDAPEVLECLHDTLNPGLLPFIFKRLSVDQTTGRKRRNEYAIAMHLGIFIHPNQIVTCEVDFHNIACNIVQIGE